jgi:RNA polymerase sigma factor for flagellar operon FliA
MLSPYGAAETPGRKEEIIRQFLPRVKYYANKYAFGLPAELSVEDLVSAGIVGLLEAINRFDPSMNTTLSTFADFRIRGAIIDEIRSMQWASKDTRKRLDEVRQTYAAVEKETKGKADDEEVARRLNISLDELYKILASVNCMKMMNLDDMGISDDGESLDIMQCIASEGQKDVLEELGLRELQSELGKVIDALPEKERLVITLYYYEELTMKEVGKVLGITESRVCQLHGKALLKLRGKLDEFRH